LVRNEIKQAENQNHNLPRLESKLYIYDVTKNEAKEISFTETQHLNLDSSVKSPDDFEVVYGSRVDGFFPLLFWSERDYNSRYLSGQM
jgi:hypothetical protein